MKRERGIPGRRKRGKVTPEVAVLNRNPAEGKKKT